MIRHPLIAAVLAASLLGAAARAQTVEVAGVKFQPTIQVGGSPLLLNGYDLRFKAIFKVYAARLRVLLPGDASPPAGTLIN